MPIVSARYTLSKTTPTKVVAASTQPQVVQLHNGTKSSNEYIIIGGTDVTFTNGYHIDNAESIQIPLTPGDDLYAVSDPTGLVLHVLAVTQD
jgi:hypothetical protein